MRSIYGNGFWEKLIQCLDGGLHVNLGYGAPDGIYCPCFRDRSLAIVIALSSVLDGKLSRVRCCTALPIPMTL